MFVFSFLQKFKYETFCGPIILLILDIVEFVWLANVIWYKWQEPSTDGMMFNHVICLVFNTKEAYKMVAPMTMKIIIFQLSVGIGYLKKDERLSYFLTSIVSNKHASNVAFLLPWMWKRTRFVFFYASLLQLIMIFFFFFNDL